jgi:hypothetical protein
VQSLQTDRIVPIASFAGNRDPGASPPAQYPAAHRGYMANSYENVLEIADQICG